ncbi:hypothetical protein PQR53_04735 [Paraburkholderia fungorum]|uniref:hypothetical protein n=1 Tax=Paraburkholderia fungorum TaxID=134537 RepID=UPI0038BCC4D2
MSITIKPATLLAAHGLNRSAMTGAQSIDLLMLVITQQAQRKLSEQVRRESRHATSHPDRAAMAGQDVIAAPPLHPVEFN